jgi:hypothetical protein
MEIEYSSAACGDELLHQPPRKPLPAELFENIDPVQLITVSMQLASGCPLKSTISKTCKNPVCRRIRSLLVLINPDFLRFTEFRNPKLPCE